MRRHSRGSGGDPVRFPSVPNQPGHRLTQPARRHPLRLRQLPLPPWRAGPAATAAAARRRPASPRIPWGCGRRRAGAEGLGLPPLRLQHPALDHLGTRPRAWQARPCRREAARSRFGGKTAQAQQGSEAQPAGRFSNEDERPMELASHLRGAGQARLYAGAPISSAQPSPVHEAA